MRTCLTCACPASRPFGIYCVRCVTGFLAWRKGDRRDLLAYAQENAVRHKCEARR